jgi:acyl carrier protein
METWVDRGKIVAFLETIRRPGASLEAIDDAAGLVAAGLIDSLAMLEIIAFLEGEFGIDFSESGVDPAEMESIQAILALIQKHAREP